MTHVFTTHKHADHSGGNLSLAETWPGLKVIGGKEDNIPGCTNPVEDGTVISGSTIGLPGVTIRCMHVPCHTKGHILYYCEVEQSSTDISIASNVLKEGVYQKVEGNIRLVFTGDTVFLGGCGRFFEGVPKQMLSALDRFALLPDDTRVYCGHEYTLSNLDFALKVEPSNEHILKYKELCTNLVDSGRFTVPGIVSGEKLYNVFMRCRESAI